MDLNVIEEIKIPEQYKFKILTKLIIIVIIIINNNNLLKALPFRIMYYFVMHF